MELGTHARLQAELTQRQNLTAAQQTSLRLLRMTAPELLSEAALALAENPFLDGVVSTDTDPEPTDASAAADAPEGGLPSNTPLEGIYASWGGDFRTEEGDPLDRFVSPISERAGLLAEARSLGLPEAEERCLLCLIEELNEHGLLTTPLDEVARLYEAWAGSEIAPWASALRTLRNMDPPGIGQPTGADALAEQIRRLSHKGETDPQTASLALRLLTDFLRELAAHDVRRLSHVTKQTAERVEAALRLIRRLDPHPLTLDADAADYVLPDLYVRWESDRWCVRLNPTAHPELRLSALAADRRATDSTQLKPYFEEAERFVRAVEQRAATVLKTARYLVGVQQDFFTSGPAALKPLRQKDAAEALGLSPSTVSRATVGKYLQGPNGTIELQALFSNGLAVSASEECASAEVSTARIRARIAELISKEDPATPLSDRELAERLAAEGLPAARRTVAKYREEVGLPVARLRRRV